MASITSEDESSEDNLSFSSPKSNFSIISDEISSEKLNTSSNSTVFSKKPPNLATNILNRQVCF